MKICPVCESALFDDMDTCFGCLYRFGSDPALEAARAAAMPWPAAIDGKRAVLISPEQGGGPDVAVAANSGGAGRGPTGKGIALGGADEDRDPDGDGRSSNGGGGDADDLGGDFREGGPFARDVRVPGWRLRVRSEGPLPRESTLTIEIEPAP